MATSTAGAHLPSQKSKQRGEFIPAAEINSFLTSRKLNPEYCVWCFHKKCLQREDGKCQDGLWELRVRAARDRKQKGQAQTDNKHNSKQNNSGNKMGEGIKSSEQASRNPANTVSTCDDVKWNKTSNIWEYVQDGKAMQIWNQKTA